MKLVCVFVCLIGAASAEDLELKRQTDAELRKLYDTAQTRVFGLTSTCPPGWRLCELTGFLLDGNLVRVVAAGWDDSGRHAAEFFFRGDSVIFLFESVEYLPERARAGAWKNFKGLAGWERRVYFRGSEAAHVETSGTPTSPIPASAGKELRAILSALQRSAG